MPPREGHKTPFEGTLFLSDRLRIGELELEARPRSVPPPWDAMAKGQKKHWKQLSQ